MSPYRPEEVIPQALRPVVEPLPYWFVIGDHGVRCLVPYRWRRVREFFLTRVGALLVPPAELLAIQRQRIDVALGDA